MHAAIEFYKRFSRFNSFLQEQSTISYHNFQYLTFFQKYIHYLIADHYSIVFTIERAPFFFGKLNRFAFTRKNKTTRAEKNRRGNKSARFFLSPVKPLSLSRNEKEITVSSSHDGEVNNNPVTVIVDPVNVEKKHRRMHSLANSSPSCQRFAHRRNPKELWLIRGLVEARWAEKKNMGRLDLRPQLVGGRREVPDGTKRGWPTSLEGRKGKHLSSKLWFHRRRSSNQSLRLHRI